MSLEVCRKKKILSSPGRRRRRERAPAGPPQPASATRCTTTWPRPTSRKWKPLVTTSGSISAGRQTASSNSSWLAVQQWKLWSQYSTQLMINIIRWTKLWLSLPNTLWAAQVFYLATPRSGSMCLTCKWQHYSEYKLFIFMLSHLIGIRLS